MQNCLQELVNRGWKPVSLGSRVPWTSQWPKLVTQRSGNLPGVLMSTCLHLLVSQSKSTVFSNHPQSMERYAHETVKKNACRSLFQNDISSPIWSLLPKMCLDVRRRKPFQSRQSVLPFFLQRADSVLPVVSRIPREWLLRYWTGELKSCFLVIPTSWGLKCMMTLVVYSFRMYTRTHTHTQVLIQPILNVLQLSP